MNLVDLIDVFKSKYGLSDLTPNSDGVFRLGINGQYIVYLANSLDSDDFFLYSDICSIYPDINSKASSYERLLTANLFGKETHTAYFAVDTTRDIILLIQRFEPNFIGNFEDFIEHFREFANYLSYWNQKIQDGELISANVETKPSQTNISIGIERRFGGRL